MAMTMKIIVFWDITLCGSGLNRCFGGTYCPLFHPACFPFSCVFLSSDDQSAVTCLSVISCYSPALKMEVIHSSETSVQTRATRCYIQEDDILQSKECL
jgi:hypothetical protein